MNNITAQETALALTNKIAQSDTLPSNTRANSFAKDATAKCRRKLNAGVPSTLVFLRRFPNGDHGPW